MHIRCIPDSWEVWSILKFKMGERSETKLVSGYLTSLLSKGLGLHKDTCKKKKKKRCAKRIPNYAYPKAHYSQSKDSYIRQRK